VPWTMWALFWLGVTVCVCAVGWLWFGELVSEWYYWKTRNADKRTRMFVRTVWVACRDNIRYWKQLRAVEQVIRQARDKEA